MKIWVDDVRSAPNGYIWLKSVNGAKSYIETNERICKEFMQKYHDEMQTATTNTLKDTRRLLNFAGRRCIELINIDHDAGEYASDGGDYIKLLDWLEEKGYNIPIHIHSMNPVGVENMRRIIRRNNWKEV